MSQCILLIDDDEALHSLLGPYLEQAGFRVAHALDGRQGLAAHQQHPADLILLDIMLPGMDGWEICRLIRQESPVPIIMLTAKGEEIDKLRGFQLGVDDYITKPFSFAELTARIKAVLNRAAPVNQPAVSELRFGDLTIDIDRHLVRRGDQLIDLTPTEFLPRRIVVARGVGAGVHQRHRLHSPVHLVFTAKTGTRPRSAPLHPHRAGIRLYVSGGLK